MAESDINVTADALARRQPECFCVRYADILPLDEVVVAEAMDYLVHFCGLACFALWRDVAIRYVERSTTDIQLPAGRKDVDT